jgi:hypothetical protein
MSTWNGEPYPGFFKEMEENLAKMEHGIPSDAILRWDENELSASWVIVPPLKADDEESDVKKIVSAPEEDRSKHLQDVIGDLDMDQLDFVDFYEVEGEPDLLEIRVRGKLKPDIGTTTEQKDTPTPSSPTDDAWERAKGVI